MSRLLRYFPLASACQACRAATTEQVRCNSNRASVTRIKRRLYPRMYPTMLVLPDGATINVRYKEPRKIIKLPVDITSLSEGERLARLAKRRPKQKIVIQEDIDDSFDVNQYSHLWKKK